MPVQVVGDVLRPPHALGSADCAQVSEATSVPHNAELYESPNEFEMVSVWR